MPHTMIVKVHSLIVEQKPLDQAFLDYTRVWDPSTHVLTPPYIGAPREVARDNIKKKFSQHYNWPFPVKYTSESA